MAKQQRKQKKPTEPAPFAVADWPAARGTVMVKVAEITPHPKNPRVHPDGQITGIGASFDEFGVVVPPVLDEKHRLIAGEGRWIAAKKKGIEELPCIIVKGWSESKKRRFMVADNRLPMLASFDDAIYREVLTLIRNEGLPLEALGLDDAAIAEALAEPNTQLIDPDAIIPERPKKPAVRRGDLWLLGEHRIICGDATNAEDVKRVLGDETPKLMVTDPPYGVNYNPLWREGLGQDASGKVQRTTSGKTVNQFRANATGKVLNDDRSDWREAWALFPGDVAYVWSASLHTGSVQMSLEAAGFRPRAHIIWNKQTMVFGRGDYHWKHEPCWYAVREGRPGGWTGDRKQTTVWDIANHNPMGGNKDEEQTGHGTQKPIECMRRPIVNNSRKGAAVYEPFSGSGTTIIACEMTGRRALAIEIDPGYVQVAIERWEKATGKLATLDGRTLAQVAKARRRGLPKGGTDEARDSRKPVRRKGPVAPTPDPPVAQ